MTGRERRAAEAARLAFRAKSIRTAYDYLANHAAPTVVGATLILPDGTMSYISTEAARATNDKAKPRSRG